MTVIPASLDRGGVQAALTSRAAGWVVATLLAGALTGLAVNMATAPPVTVLRQVGAVGPVQIRGAAIAPPLPESINVLGPCGALAPGPRIIKLGSKGALVIGGQRVITIPAPGSVVGPAKRARVIQVPVNTLVPSCGLGLGPAARCGVVQIPANVRLPIHAVGPSQRVILRRLTPAKFRRQITLVTPGTQVVVPGPIARIFCPG